MRILVTGMSGVGKSTLLEEMASRGFLTVDTDYGDWETALGHWREDRMDALLFDHPDVIVSGTVANQGQFYDRFEHVVLLSAPIGVLIARVTIRTNNPYGKTSAQQQEIRKNLRDVEPLLRNRATVEFDARISTDTLADSIQSLMMEL